MKRTTRPFPLVNLLTIREKIDMQPHYQRPLVWSRPQKQLLIDTVLRDLDIPKIYFNDVNRDGYEYEVVDGQQRLNAIFEYQSGDFPLRPDADPVNGHEIAGCRFPNLPDELKFQWNGYCLDVVLLSEADEDDIREMFLRLQNGSTLRAAEKRNALPGNMTEFIRELAKLPFYESCAFNNRRYDYDHMAAQMTCMELAGGPTDIKNKDLERMYLEGFDFDATGPLARKIRRVLGGLHEAFPEKTPELARYNANNLYMMLSNLYEAYVFHGREDELAKWFLDFESTRRTELKKPEDEQNQRLVAYHTKTQHATDATDSLKYRFDVLMEKFFQSVPDVHRLDGQRSYADHQRIAIFRRDDGICQLQIKCDGRKCSWDSWEADHRVAWSQGGPTTVDNGQVACSECNAAKGASAVGRAGQSLGTRST